MRQRLLVILWLMFLVSVACNSKPVMSTASPLSPTVTPSSVPSTTPIPLPALTTTSLPTAAFIPVIKPTVTWVSSPTPSPTLTNDEEQSLVLNLLKDNGGCELPCWWGITPGKTDWDTLRNRYIAFGGTNFDVISANHLRNYSISHTFVNQNNTVESIQVMGETAGNNGSDRFAEDWQRYSLDQVLDRYGVPSRVWVFLLPITEPGSLSLYGLTVTYDKLGVSIYYEGFAGQSKSTIHACPDMKRTLLVLLQLQSPNLNTSPAQSVFPDGKPYVRTLEQATGMSLEAFYKTFKDANKRACLDYSALWP